MGVSRDRTIVIKKSEGIVPDYSTFCDLVDEFHVSFTSKNVMMNVAANYRKETSNVCFFVDPVERKRAYLKVYGMLYEAYT